MNHFSGLRKDLERQPLISEKVLKAFNQENYYSSRDFHVNCPYEKEKEKEK